MCGAGSSNPQLARTKAAKTKVLLGWVRDLLNTQGGAAVLDDDETWGEEVGTNLLLCADKINEFYLVLAAEGRVVSEHAFPQLQACARRATQAWFDAGGQPTTKFHVFESHLIDQMREFGNCTYTHNYLDESEQFASRVRSTRLHRGETYGKTHLSKWYAGFMSHSYY